jgi:AcrR family transcriptional regulator
MTERHASTPSGSALKPRRPYAPRMPPERRREQLLDAALGVILRQGYTGISVEAVARAAGVTRPVIYDHFSNLGRLLQALIEREEHTALEELGNVFPEDAGVEDPIRVLASGVGRFLHAVLNRPDSWRIILLPPEGTPAIVREHIERNRQRTLKRIERLVRAGMARAGFPEALDPELTARMIRDLGEEAGRMVLTNPMRYTPERYERFAQALMDLLWPGSGRVRSRVASGSVRGR